MSCSLARAVPTTPVTSTQTATEHTVSVMDGTGLTDVLLTNTEAEYTLHPQEEFDQQTRRKE